MPHTVTPGFLAVPDGGELAKEAGDAFDRRMELLESLIEQAPVGIAVVRGEEHRFILANPKYASLFGHDDLRGRAFLEIQNGSTLAQTAVEAFATVRRTGRPCRIGDVRATVDKGAGREEEAFFSCAFLPIESAEGMPDGILIIIDETTERVRDRRALEESEERHRLVAELTSDYIVHLKLDGAGRICSCWSNKSLAPAIGYELTELLSLGANPAIYRADNLAKLKAFQHKILAGETAVCETPIQAKSGQTTWWQVAGRPLKGEDGRVSEIIYAAKDITGLHELEEAKADYLRMVTHDLRSPLSVVQSWAQLAERAAGDPAKVRLAMGKIVAAVDRLNDMLRDLADAGRLDADRIVLRREPLDLCGNLRSLLAGHGHGLETGRIHLDCPADLPPVSADPARLERIVLNLLKNALRYSPPGSRVDVTLRRERDHIITEVRDRGPGIQPEQQREIFERFHRDQASPEREEGLGLGLYIAKGLVEAHGGRIWVESTPGEGSVFSFSLPLFTSSPESPCRIAPTA